VVASAVDSLADCCARFRSVLSNRAYWVSLLLLEVLVGVEVRDCCRVSE